MATQPGGLPEALSTGRGRSFQAEVLRLPKHAGAEQLRSYAMLHRLAGRVISPLLQVVVP